ncbi:hypothetical protein WJ542_05545 [Paraburkholderia sp. B3]|uniref:hypothetical protein n=1 Tax=Paraburkholderia sp. B3 TaxID=3134791 RepID=UPI003982C67B
MKNANTGIARFALCASMTAILTACGGGGGGSNSAAGTSGNGSSSQTQISGKVIDGYISGVTVCLDNGQSACDNSQPTATTDNTGSYSFKVAGDMTGKKLLAIVPAGATDVTSGTTLQNGFTLSAVVSGSTQNVTPLTTMVVAQMNAGQSQQQATQSVQQLVGSQVDPNADYIASGDTATAAISADMVSHMTTLAGQGPVSWSLVQATLNAYVSKGTVDGVGQSDVDAQLTNPAFSQAVAATTALAGPLYTVDGDMLQQVPDSVWSTSVSPVRENWTLSGQTLSVTQEVQSNGKWSPVSPVGSYDAMFSGNFISLTSGEGAYLMKTDGSWTNWLTNDQLHPAYTLSQTGNNLVGTDPNTGDTVTVSYRTTDVSGEPLSTALQIDYRNPVRSSMTGSFPAGTTAYLATMQHANDQIMLTANGIGIPWLNGAFTSIAAIPLTGLTAFPNGLTVSGLGSASQTYTSVQQVAGTQIAIGGSCLLLDIEANGVAQIVESGAHGCNYGNEPLGFPVTGSWSVYPRNPDVITISLPKAVGAPDVPIDDTIKNTINAGGSLVIALMNGKLVSGYMVPATSPTTVLQVPAALTNTIATSMRAAAATIGMQQNP